jgi:hypothetical protein
MTLPNTYQAINARIGTVGCGEFEFDIPDRELDKEENGNIEIGGNRSFLLRCELGITEELSGKGDYEYSIKSYGCVSLITIFTDGDAR